jgi:high-affinity Fe2+/Pb2+ permease
MRFYYWSFLNWIPITIYYVVAVILLLAVWWLIKKKNKAKYIMGSLIPVMLILPWTQELWISICDRGRTSPTY